MAYEREREVAIAAVREAGALCRTVQSRIDGAVLEKKDRSPVTVADFGSQALVCRALAEAFPDDPVIAEEDAAVLREADNAALLQRVCGHVQDHRPGTDDATVCAWIDRGCASAYSPRFWTLDPIDGTKGFLRGGQYAVALALIVEGELTVAAMACPNMPTDEWAGEAPDPEKDGAIFSAVRGQGAAMTPMRSTGAGAPISASSTTDPGTARFCESVEAEHSSHSDAAAVAKALGIAREPIRLDSQAKYATVARGLADIYLRLPTRAGYVEKIWDHAAGALVVIEAGGRVTDIEGRELDFSHGYQLETNRGMIVTNGHLHTVVLDAVRKQLG
ncbi:MAG: 3'(2'),5'-bisphosphate nucleotidase [Phycisphaerae bacterium]|nr:3'(2'),5'-bisphosphate nucleotidase [Phycisphaerae bacterium]